MLRLIDRPSEFTTRDCIRESTETKNNFALNLAHSRHAGMCVPLALARDHPSFCIQIGSRCFCTSLTHFSVVSLVQIGGLDRIGYFRSLISCTIPCSVISPAFSNAHTLCQSVCITTLSLVAYSGFWGGFLPAVWLGVPATLPTLCERIAPSLNQCAPTCSSHPPFQGAGKGCCSPGLSRGRSLARQPPLNLFFGPNRLVSQLLPR